MLLTSQQFEGVFNQCSTLKKHSCTFLCFRYLAVTFPQKMIIKQAVSLSYSRPLRQVMIDNFCPSTRDNLVYHLVIMHSGFDPGHSIRQCGFCDHFFSHIWLPVPPPGHTHSLWYPHQFLPHFSPTEETAILHHDSQSLSHSFIMKCHCLHSLQNVCLNTTPFSPWGFGPCSLMLMIYFSIWSYSV